MARGDIVGERRRREPLTRDWLFSAVDTVPEAGCWIWRGCHVGDGYGTVGFAGRYKAAHRVSYELHVGEIPDGMVVMHKCDTPSCVNPSHLSVGTKFDNNRDRHAKMRSASKLNAGQVVAIFGDSRKQSVIAKEYGIDQSTVSDIKRGKRWSYLTEKEN